MHANAEKTVAGSRHYIHAEDVADALLFLYNYNISSMQPDSTGAKCPKFNIVGKDEIDNLELAKFIAKCQNKELKYELVDFHSQRPGHDLRYAIDSTKIQKELGWVAKESFETGIKKTVEWYLSNETWWKSILENTYNQERLGVEKS